MVFNLRVGVEPGPVETMCMQVRAKLHGGWEQYEGQAQKWLLVSGGCCALWDQSS